MDGRDPSLYPIFSFIPGYLWAPIKDKSKTNTSSVKGYAVTFLDKI